MVTWYLRQISSFVKVAPSRVVWPTAVDRSVSSIASIPYDASGCLGVPLSLIGPGGHRSESALMREPGTRRACEVRPARCSGRRGSGRQGTRLIDRRTRAPPPSVRTSSLTIADRQDEQAGRDRPRVQVVRVVHNRRLEDVTADLGQHEAAIGDRLDVGSSRCKYQRRASEQRSDAGADNRILTLSQESGPVTCVQQPPGLPFPQPDHRAPGWPPQGRLRRRPRRPGSARSLTPPGRSPRTWQLPGNRRRQSRTPSQAPNPQYPA